MPRIARKYLETNYYHVMTQGINKQFIFQKSEEKKFYIKTMYEIKQELNVNMLAYCIMDNHTHCLVKVEDIKKLSKFMQRLNSKYAYYYNKRHNRVGYVFRDRFKAEGIYSERQLYCCMKYIYDNPVKAGICNSASDYKFSNYRKININNNEYEFIDEEIEDTINCENLVNDFLSNYNINKEELIGNKAILKKLILVLKNNYKISIRKVSNELGIPRETIRRISK